MAKIKLFSLISILIWIILWPMVIAGQTGLLQGHVIMKQTDNTTSPVSDALIDIWRADKFEEHRAKTYTDGKFKLNLPYKGNYIVGVSAQNAEPKFFLNIKASRGNESDMEIILSPGDGRR